MLSYTDKLVVVFVSLANLNSNVQIPLGYQKESCVKISLVKEESERFAEKKRLREKIPFPLVDEKKELVDEKKELVDEKKVLVDKLVEKKNEAASVVENEKKKKVKTKFQICSRTYWLLPVEQGLG